ncbi:hypothetical protein B2A_05578, partial [mine drainage metagenome]
SPPSGPPTTLGQVVVEASRPPALGLDTGARVKILSATALRNLGVDNLGQALRLMPIFGSANGLGTASTDKFTNGGEQSADLFDLTNSRVVILVNGQRWIQGAQGDTDLSTFPVALIENRCLSGARRRAIRRRGDCRRNQYHHRANVQRRDGRRWNR